MLNTRDLYARSLRSLLRAALSFSFRASSLLRGSPCDHVRARARARGFALRTIIIPHDYRMLSSFPSASLRAAVRKKFYLAVRRRSPFLGWAIKVSGSQNTPTTAVQSIFGG